MKNITLGDKMRCLIGNLIHEKGFKAKYIAAQLEVTPQQMSNWVNNRNYPPLEKAFKLAKLLGVKVDDLYDEEVE
ncbi:helix-turn-helix transcriptional regulator [Peribacillus sp. JNUCC 23]